MKIARKLVSASVLCGTVLAATAIGLSPAQAEPGDWWTHDSWGYTWGNGIKDQAAAAGAMSIAESKASAYIAEQEKDLSISCYFHSWDQGSYMVMYPLFRYSAKIVVKCVDQT